jgi:F420-non-reducing hydrogenase iron-sulfur subunit
MHRIRVMNKLKIDLFYCSTRIDPGQLEHSINGFELKAIPLPCSGKVDLLYLTKAFETGADGVALITCKPGECRYLEGNLRARKRVEAVDSLLDEIGVGKGRMTIIQLDDGGTEQVIKKVKEFCRGITALPRKVQSEDYLETDE